MKISSHDARSSLSPRAGRGRGEGASTLPELCNHHQAAKTLPVSSESRRGPLNPSFSPHAGRRSRERRGESDGASALVLATHVRPRLADQSYEFSSPQRKRREAERRKGATVSWGLATQRMLPSICASGAAARSAERARLSALHRGSRSGHMPKLNPGRASRDAARRRYPHLGTALKRSTSRAGRNAGGVDARTARERQ
jgi:hypothetical protein